MSNHNDAFVRETERRVAIGLALYVGGTALVLAGILAILGVVAILRME